MPEGPEIEVEKLNETIHEEMEKEGGRFLKHIALTTAVLAAFAAVAALKAGSTVNEALVLKTESTRLQAQASDQWTFYQAKGLKAAVQEASKASWEALGKEAPHQFVDKAARNTEEQVEIKKLAEEFEKSRDEKSAEADHLLHEHHRFANTVALFQVSIALGALAALTRNRPLWIGSLAVGLSGITLFVLSLTRNLHTVGGLLLSLSQGNMQFMSLIREAIRPDAPRNVVTYRRPLRFFEIFSCLAGIMSQVQILYFHFKNFRRMH